MEEDVSQALAFEYANELLLRARFEDFVRFAIQEGFEYNSTSDLEESYSRVYNADITIY